MSRATFAVDMWSMIGPARAAQAASNKPSDSIHSRSSALVTGNANGAMSITARNSSTVSKHSIGALRAIPRGSNPMMSKRARTRSENMNRPTAWMKSTPEPPGPPGFVKIEPIRFDGLLAGSRVIARRIVGPSGSS